MSAQPRCIGSDAQATPLIRRSAPPFGASRGRTRKSEPLLADIRSSWRDDLLLASVQGCALSRHHISSSLFHQRRVTSMSASTSAAGKRPFHERAINLKIVLRHAVADSAPPSAGDGAAIERETSRSCLIASSSVSTIWPSPFSTISGTEPQRTPAPGAAGHGLDHDDAEWLQQSTGNSSGEPRRETSLFRAR